MRNILLYTIGSILLLTIFMSSCIKGEDTDYAYSTDVSVRAFSIDTIKGVKYPFSIDLLNSRIYNVDSLPYLSDTLLKSFIIDTFTVIGHVYSGDTVLSTPAYTDLTKAMNGADGIMFTVYAGDGVTSHNYRLDVRVHMQDPDSLSWSQQKNIPNALATADLGDSFKMVSTDDELLIFSGNSQSVYHTPVGDGSSYNWEEDALSGLPENADWSTVMTFNGQFFLNTSDGDVYCSTDGRTWEKSTPLSANVKTLLTGMTERLLGIQTIDGTDYFCYTASADDAWSIGKQVPEGFPTEQIQSTVFTTSTGVEKATLTGMPLENDTIVVPWFTFNGEEWAALDTEEMYCPGINHPTILNYANNFYIFGNKFESAYISPSTLTWEELTSKFMMPEALNGKENYSAVLDSNNFIWIVVSENGNNQLWRGRLNKLGFKRQ